MASGPRKLNESFKSYHKRLKVQAEKDKNFLKGKKVLLRNGMSYREHPLFWDSSERGTYRRV